MHAIPTIKSDDVIKIKRRKSITFIGIYGLKVHSLKAPVLNLANLLTDLNKTVYGYKYIVACRALTG
jgi:hypothetical protein